MGDTPISIEDLQQRYPGTTRQSWAQHRYRGTGPKFFKVGRSVFYRPEDVLDWESSLVQNCTDEHPAVA